MAKFSRDTILWGGWNIITIIVSGTAFGFLSFYDLHINWGFYFLFLVIYCIIFALFHQRIYKILSLAVVVTLIASLAILGNTYHPLFGNYDAPSMFPVRPTSPQSPYIVKSIPVNAEAADFSPRYPSQYDFYLFIKRVDLYKYCNYFASDVAQNQINIWDTLFLNMRIDGYATNINEFMPLNFFKSWCTPDAVQIGTKDNNMLIFYIPILLTLSEKQNYAFQVHIGTLRHGETIPPYWSPFGIGLKASKNIRRNNRLADPSKKVATSLMQATELQDIPSLVVLTSAPKSAVVKFFAFDKRQFHNDKLLLPLVFLLYFIFLSTVLILYKLGSIFYMMLTIRRHRWQQVKIM